MDVPIHERRDRFEALVRKQYGMLLAYIRAIAGQSERADDLFQKTMLEAWTHFEKFDSRRPPGPWLRGIARNVVNSERRVDARRWRRFEEFVAQRLDDQFDYIEDKAQLEFDEVIEVLKDCLEKLNRLYRTPLQHCYWGGLSVREAAEKTGLTLEACKKRLQRGREMLGRCMSGKGVLAPTKGGS
jgi:RNA polymerase sigma-70 factor (ECF subfamily)